MGNYICIKSWLRGKRNGACLATWLMFGETHAEECPIYTCANISRSIRYTMQYIITKHEQYMSALCASDFGMSDIQYQTSVMLYESCVFHLSNDSVVWPSCCTGLCVKKARLTSQFTKTLESTSIRNRSDVKMSDRCLIDVDPIVLVFWEVMGILQWDKIHRYDAVLLQVA